MHNTCTPPTTYIPSIILQSVFDSPVGGIACHKVDVLSQSSSMHDALRMLLVHHALPVVDESGKLMFFCHALCGDVMSTASVCIMYVSCYNLMCK